MDDGKDAFHDHFQDHGYREQKDRAPDRARRIVSMRAADRFLYGRPKALRVFLWDGDCLFHDLLSTVIILKTNDVVFAEIISSLHFYENEIRLARVLDAMSSADGNVDRFAGLHENLFAVA